MTECPQTDTDTFLLILSDLDIVRVGALLGLLLTLLVATSEIGPREAARKQSPESAAATARGYAEAAHALSLALAASDDAFDQAWSDGNADWDRIGAAAADSAAIIDAAQADFSADRAVLPSGPEEAELVRFADLFQKADRKSTRLNSSHRT